MTCSARGSGFILLIALMLLSLAASAQNSAKPTAQPASATPQVVYLFGLQDVKAHAKGKLTVDNKGLDFTGAASHAQIPLGAIEDVFTGEDTRQSGGKPLTVAKMAIPYGGGRVLSLFTHEKFDSLTIEYRDENGGLHGVLFTMPAGQALELKKQLIAQGAKVSTPAESPSATKDAAEKEKK